MKNLIAVLFVSLFLVSFSSCCSKGNKCPESEKTSKCCDKQKADSESQVIVSDETPVSAE